MTELKNTSAPAFAGRSFLSQTFSFGLIQVIGRFRGLVGLAILSRIIGSSGYGLLSLLLALASIIPAFILLGAQTSLNVFIAGNQPDQRRKEFWGIAQLTMILSLTALVLLVVLFPFVKNILLPSGITSQLFIAAMLMVPISSLQLVFYAQIVNNRQGRAYSKVIALTAVFDLLLLGLSAYWFGLIGTLFATLISQTILCGFMIWIVQTEDKFFLLSFEGLKALAKYYKYGLAIFFAGVAAWFIQSSDRFIIAKYLPTDLLGVYQVAYGLCLQLNELAVPMFAPLLPFLTDSIKENNQQQAQRYLSETLKVLLFVYSPAVILLSANARDIISIIATGDFTRGAIIIPFVATGVALWQIVGVFAYNLHAHKAGQIMLVSLGIAALVNVVMNFIFIPMYGLIAAALSTLVAYALHFLIILYFSQRKLRTPLEIGFSLKLAAASGLMLIATLYTQNLASELSTFLRLCASMIIGGAAYLTAVYLLKLYSSTEMMRVFNSVKQILIPNKEK